MSILSIKVLKNIKKCDMMGSQKVKTNTKNTMKIRKTVLAGADKLLKRLGMGVLVAALVTGAVLAVKHFQKSDAATYVDVSYGWNGYVGPYYFGDMYSQYDGAENRTSFYSVASNGYSYGAMCAQPMFGGAAGSMTYGVASDTIKKILLVSPIGPLYQDGNGPAASIFANLRAINTQSSRTAGATTLTQDYTLAHSMIGINYAGSGSSGTQSIGWSTSGLTALQNAVSQINAIFATGQYDAYLTGYTAYHTNGYNSSYATPTMAQDVVWLEGSLVEEEGTLTITKTDADTGATLSGAVFYIYSDALATNLVATTSATGSNGQTSVTLPISISSADTRYYVKEAVAPTGYELNTGIYTAILSNSATAYTLTITNAKTPPLTGPLTIYKYEEGTTTPLAGAVFEFYEDNCETGTLLTTLTTGSAGTVSYTVTEGVKYCIKEATAPTGYNNLTATWTWTAGPNSNGVINQEIIAYNSKKTASIVVTKTDGETNSVTPQGGASLAGAVFGLYQSGGSSPIQTATVGADGTAVFSGVNYGDYEVKEITAGTGYALNGLEYPVTVSDASGTIETVTVDNDVVRGGILVRKIDAETGAASTELDGTKFNLVNNSANAVVVNGTAYARGATVATLTIANGQAATSTTALPYGDYLLVETVAADKYILDTTQHAVSIRSSGQIVEIEVENEKIFADVKITKTDNETTVSQGDADLDGAKFGIYTTDGTLVDTLTIADGRATKTGLEAGNYYLQEISAGTGYVKNTTKQNFTIAAADNDTEKVFNITNQIIRGGVRIIKVNEQGETDTALDGTEFTIKNVSNDSVYVDGELYEVGEDIATLVIEDGSAELSSEKLPYGTYEIRETKAVDSYVNLEDVYTVQIRENGVVVTKTISNTKALADIKLTKKDKETEDGGAQGDASLAGAKFGIYEAGSKKLVRELVVDGSVATTEELEVGSYYLQEIEAGAGYKLNEEKLAFSITKAEHQKTLKFEAENEVIRGGLVITKIDENTGKVNPALDGTEFTVYNKSAKSVMVDGEEYGVDEAIAVLVIKDGSAELSSDSLPYGTYEIRETKTVAGYVEQNLSKVIEIREDGQVLELEVKNKKIEILPDTGRFTAGVEGARKEYIWVAAGAVVVMGVVIRKKCSSSYRHGRRRK